MKVELHPRFSKRARRLNASDRILVADALVALHVGFGFPHLHSGLGIRRLRKDLFECRAGLHWRIVFFVEKRRITAYNVMTYDELKSWLRDF